MIKTNETYETGLANQGIPDWLWRLLSREEEVKLPYHYCTLPRGNRTEGYKVRTYWIDKVYNPNVEYSTRFFKNRQEAIEFRSEYLNWDHIKKYVQHAEPWSFPE